MVPSRRAIIARHVFVNLSVVIVANYNPFRASSAFENAPEVQRTRPRCRISAPPRNGSALIQASYITKLATQRREPAIGPLKSRLRPILGWTDRPLSQRCGFALRGRRLLFL